MEARECALCRLAERQPAEPAIFFVKDNNPRKPHRWLALPRKHGEHRAPPAEHDAGRTHRVVESRHRESPRALGNQWGIAYNGPMVRTQCHAHVHIGKLLKGVETRRFIVVAKPEQIPLPDGEGIWIHPVGRKLHVHLGEQTCETVLLR